MNREKVRKLFSDKRTRIVIILVAALLLLLLVWKVFFGSKQTTLAAYQPTETEERLASILVKMDGIDGVSVLVGESDGTAVSAVIVFEGEDSILTRMRILDVTASALSLKKENVLVYPA